MRKRAESKKIAEGLMLTEKFKTNSVKFRYICVRLGAKYTEFDRNLAGICQNSSIIANAHVSLPEFLPYTIHHPVPNVFGSSLHRRNPGHSILLKGVEEGGGFALRKGQRAAAYHVYVRPLLSNDVHEFPS